MDPGTASKIPIVAAISLNETGHPISEGAKRQLAAIRPVLSDGLAGFRAVTTANCQPKAVVTGGKHSNDYRGSGGSTPCWATLKTSFSDTFHLFNFDKDARGDRGGDCLQFNRHLPMAGMTEGIVNAVCCCC